MNVPARRACARIAWRQARRAPVRSCLIGALVALPVAALTFGASVFSSAQVRPEDRATAHMGTADLTVTFHAPVPLSLRDVRAVWPDGTLVAPVYRGYRTVTVGERASLALVEETRSIHERPLRGRYVIVDGRAPAAPGEIALHARHLERLGIGIGDRVEVGGAEAVVTGSVVRPLQVSGPVAILGSGTLPEGKAEISPTYYIDVPDAVDPTVVFAQVSELDQLVKEARGTRRPSKGGDGGDSRSQVEMRESSALAGIEEAEGTASAFALAGLALAATGLVAGAAFAVGTRRQLRTLGLVTAVGGAQKDARGVVLLGGTVLGAAGGVLGVALGLGLLMLARPHLWQLTGMLSPTLRVNVPAVLGGVGLAVVASTVAAYLPARAASKVPPALALSGIQPPPRPPGRMAVVGAIALAAGIPVTILGARDEQTAALLLGPGLLIGGVLMALPIVVGLVGRTAKILPAPLRLAARDAARHGRRTSTALAAASIGLTVAVMIAVAAETNEADVLHRGPLGPQHVTISSFGATTGPGRLVEALRRRFPSADVATVRHAVDPDGSIPGSVFFVLPARPGSDVVTQRELAIASPAILRALDAEAADEALRSGALVVLGRQILGPEGQLRPFGEDRVFEAVEIDVRSHSSLPQILVSRARAEELGYRAAPPSSILFTDVDEVSPEEERVVASVAARHGWVFVTTLRDLIPRSTAPTIALASGAALALVIVSIVLALVAAESRRDRAILAAVGAGPLTRRKIAAAQAFLMVLVAGSFAAPAGIIPYALFESHSDLGGKVVTVPMDAMALVLLGVPVLASAAAFTLTRHPRAEAMLRPLA